MLGLFGATSQQVNTGWGETQASSWALSSSPGRGCQSNRGALWGQRKWHRLLEGGGDAHVCPCDEGHHLPQARWEAQDGQGGGPESGEAVKIHHPRGGTRSQGSPATCRAVSQTSVCLSSFCGVRTDRNGCSCRGAGGSMGTKEPAFAGSTEAAV